MPSPHMNTTDTPGVIAMPPLLYAGAFALALILHVIWPLVLVPHPIAGWAGAALMLAGLAIVRRGIATMRGAGTNVPPNRPATVIVTTGPFRWSRNPLYVGLYIAFIGASLLINTWWGIIVLIPLFALMHYGVILREERYLAAKFGTPYADYRTRVRRYF